MKVLDLIGNEILTGDLLAVKPEPILGVVTAVETGDIVRGVSLSGPKPEGQQIQPHIIVRVEMAFPMPILPNGQVAGVFKIQKPVAEKPKVTE